MPSVAQQVQEILEDDMFLLEALARDIVNYRGLARWIKAKAGLKAGEETIVSAVRRFKPRDSWDVRPARRVLSGAHVNTRSGVTALVLARGGVCDRIESLLEAGDARTRARVRTVQTGGRLVLVVEDRSLETIKEALGSGLVDVEVPDLAELEIVASEDAVGTPGVMGMLFSALGARDVSVRFAMSGYPEQLIFVDRGALLTAYEAVEGLIRSSRRAEEV